MKTHNIDLQTLTPQGSIKSEIKQGELHMTVTKAIHSAGSNIYRDKIRHAMMLPGSYRLPFRISATVKLEGPELLFLIGMGHITFGAPAADNRRIDDIANPDRKPRMFDDSLPHGQYVALDILYDFKEMQILIDGEERFYSKHQRYMRLKNFAERNEEGFCIGLTATKNIGVTVKSLVITEYKESAPILEEAHIDTDFVPAAPQIMPDRPRFDSCIAELPQAFQETIRTTDTHLKSLKNMKWKRVIDKSNLKISYISSVYGVSYALYLSGKTMYHSLQWYIVTNGKPETWHRVANMMEPALERIAETDPGLAGRIFFALNECIGCRLDCAVRTPYRFHGEKKLTCHGQAFFKMALSDFEDIRNFFIYVSKMEPAAGRTLLFA